MDTLSIEDVAERYHAVLKKRRNVLNIVISTKWVNGVDTGTPSITHVVSQKVDEKLLAAEDIIPKTIEGYLTDVIELKPVGWVAGKTRVSELSPKEQKRLLGLQMKPKGKSAPIISSGYEIDWKSQCTPTLDQGTCGSCVGASSIKDFQDNLKVLRSITVALSIQQLFFCAGGTCELGSTVEAVLNYAVSSGVALASDCPYVSYSGVDYACGYGLASDWYLRGYKLSGWNHLNTIDSMRVALSLAPIQTTMAVHASFMNYVSGVYKSQGVADPIIGYHAIEVAGDSDSLGAWEFCNSWGTGFGDGGYGWIAHGDSDFDVQMYQLLLDGPIPIPPPTPSPCPVGNFIAKVMNFFAWMLRRKGRFYYGNKGGE